MSADLQGRVAIVTGGARDIGRAVSLKLAECGASVVVNYFSSAERAKAVVADVKSDGGHAVAVRADVSRPADAKRLVDETRAAFGDRIHILVNNAGGLVGRKKLDEMDETFWD